MIQWSVIWMLLVAAVCTGCGPPPEPADGVALAGRAVAGPTCPVVTEPPDPACEDRPVAGAEIVVRDEAGEMVATARTAEDGSFSVSVAAGRYQLVPQPVEGLLGTATPVEVVVPEEGMPEPVILFYDTGIR
jgi:hypothetical protein